MKTADGVDVNEGDAVWDWHHGNEDAVRKTLSLGGWMAKYGGWYSTREAAFDARLKTLMSEQEAIKDRIKLVSDKRG